MGMLAIQDAWRRRGAIHRWSFLHHVLRLLRWLNRRPITQKSLQMHMKRQAKLIIHPRAPFPSRLIVNLDFLFVQASEVIAGVMASQNELRW